MKKKVLALVLSAAMLAGLLAGCGNSSSTNSTTGSTGNSETAAPAGGWRRRGYRIHRRSGEAESADYIPRSD